MGLFVSDFARNIVVPKMNKSARNNLQLDIQSTYNKIQA